MDRSMEAFVERQNVERYVERYVERQNVERYIDQLKTETDPVKRNVVLKLLAEEEVKQAKAST
jgi:hypothetical protein